MNHIHSISTHNNLDLFVDIPPIMDKQPTKVRLLAQYPDEGIEKVSLQSLKSEALANSMIEMLRLDLSRKPDVLAGHDLFGKSDDYRRLDALFWVFNLNLGGADITFDWCCENSRIDGESLDPETIRRIIARSSRVDLKRCLQIVSMTFGTAAAKRCEEELMEYVNLAGWQTQ